MGSFKQEAVADHRSGSQNKTNGHEWMREICGGEVGGERGEVCGGEVGGESSQYAKGTRVKL